MPTDPHDLSLRLAVCRPEDRVRGMMLNELLALVERRLGSAAAEHVRAVLPAGERYRDLPFYPITDFLKLMYAAAGALEHIEGGVEPAFRACGAATVEAFARTTAGSLFFNVLAMAGPAQVLKAAGTGYRTVVTYGAREFQPTGENSGTLVMRNDMQPLAYHEGVMTAVLHVIGYTGTAHGRAQAIDRSEYDVTWSKAPDEAP